MNQMTPTEFHDRLAAAMPEAAADYALHPSVESDLLAGRRLLRRRRGLTALGAAAVVAILAGGAGLTGLGDEPSRGTDVAAAPNDNAELLDSCRTGEQTFDAARDALFESGTPVVKALAKTDLNVVLAVESADGRYWGNCFVNLVHSEFTAGMSVYDATQRTKDSTYSVALPGCDENELCRQFTSSVVDRRVPEVAAVEFLTVDGVKTRVETVDGYYAFNYHGTLPEPLEVTIPGSVNTLKRITFFDAAGQPIAAEAQDGSGTGEDRETIPGLPSIREYPSLRSSEEITSTS